MKKIIEFEKRIVGKDCQWKSEIEIAEYPNILKRGICLDDCENKWGDSRDKDLILSEEVIWCNQPNAKGGEKIYKCLKCAYPLNDSLRASFSYVIIDQVGKNRDDWNEINRELVNYKEREERK